MEIKESMVTMTKCKNLTVTASHAIVSHVIVMKKNKKPTAKQIMVGSSILAVILSTMIVVGELSNR